jgi:hypothetical protein
VNNYEKAKIDASTKAVTEKGTVRIEYPRMRSVEEVFGASADLSSKMRTGIWLVLVIFFVKQEFFKLER